jgi:predicted permease
VLKDASASGGSHRSRVRDVFVVMQVGLSLVLLIGAGLFLRSLKEAMAIDPGFGARKALIVGIDLGLNGYPAPRVRQFQADLRERVQALSGVEAVAYASMLPLSMDGGRQQLTIDGYRAAEGEDMEIFSNAVSDGYFETMGLPLARGRAFTATDREGAPGVVIVNESFVRRYWPGSDGLGRRVSLSGPDGPFLDVVGIARDSKYQSLYEDPKPYFYRPLGQEVEDRFTLVARTSLDPATLSGPVRDAIRALDPSLPLDGVSTLEDHIDLSLLPARIAGIVLGFLGLLGLALASLGVAGVVAFGVSQRVREIGIRIALGARGGEVVRLVVRDGLRLVVIGVGAGVAVALPLAMLVRRFLYGLSPLDPAAFGSAIVVFGLAALLASWIPARRAAAVDPMVALRAE